MAVSVFCGSAVDTVHASVCGVSEKKSTIFLRAHGLCFLSRVSADGAQSSFFFFWDALHTRCRAGVSCQSAGQCTCAQEWSRALL